MKTAIKSALTLMALIGLGAVLYKYWQEDEQQQVPPESDNYFPEEDNFFHEFSSRNNNAPKEKFSRLKHKLEYTPYKEVVFDGRIIAHENCDVLNKISKEEIGIVQVVVANTSDEYRKVSLWGAKGAAMSPPDTTDILEQQLIGSGSAATGIHPQGVAINPLSGLVYVANQLSDNVGVYDSDGVLIATVQLGAGVPGAISPVALAFNPVNGEAWVVGSVSNNIYVIDVHFNITHVISGGRRPVAIAYHFINQSFYVASMLDAAVHVFNSTTYTQTSSLIPGAGSAGRLDVFIEQLSGKICVLNDSDGKLSVYGSEHILLGTVAGLGAGLLKVVGGSADGKVFVLSKTRLKEVDIIAMNILSDVALPAPCSGMAFNPFNGFLYVLSKQAGLIYAYNTLSHAFIPLTLVGSPNIGFALNAGNGRFYFTGTGESLLYVAGYGKESKWITVSDNYEELKNNLKSTPGLVLHLKIAFSTSDKFSNLFLKRHTVSGLEKGEAFSMNEYYAPQNFGNVAEVYGMRGQIIHAKMGWEFFIAPHQVITFLIKISQKVVRPGVGSPDRQPLAMAGN